MYQYKGLEDTIAAIATPAGQGGIGIIRISGKEAIAVADTVLRLQGTKHWLIAKVIRCIMAGSLILKMEKLLMRYWSP